jgi:hypothetical protein
LDRQVFAQVIVYAARAGSLAIALLIVWFTYVTWRRGYLLYGDRRVVRANEPGEFWFIVVLWCIMALLCATFALLGP